MDNNNFDNNEKINDLADDILNEPDFNYEYLEEEKDESISQIDKYYVNNLQQDAEYKKAAQKLKSVISIVLIISMIGAPLLGMGVGFGVQIANNYVLPRLLDDSSQRMSFSFGNVENQQFLAISNFVGAANYVELVSLVEPSVVTISAAVPRGNINHVGQSQSLAAGTGILMYETHTRYYIATNAHVIDGALEVSVSIAGSPYIVAMPVGKDVDADLAVIAVAKADAILAGVYNVRIAHFGTSSNMQVGDIVLAIGNAMGEGNTVTNGIISGSEREIFVAGRTLEVIQTNAAINRGNSGGPLVNSYGEVIGINTAKFVEALAEGMGYAIPTDVAMPILERIMQEPPRPMIGIDIETMGENRAVSLYRYFTNRHMLEGPFDIPQDGVFVGGVLENSPAYEAGLVTNDIITHLDGQNIETASQLINGLGVLNVGDTVTLTINRNGGEVLDIEVTLGANLRF